MAIANYEIIGSVFLLFMIYMTFISYKRKHLSKLTAILWFSVWILGIISMLFKDYFKVFLPSLAVYRIFDLYTIIGFMFFLFMVFYLFRIVKKNEKRVEELTRIIALGEGNIK